MFLFLVTSTGKENMVARRQNACYLQQHPSGANRKLWANHFIKQSTPPVVWCCIFFNHLSCRLRQLGLGTKHNTSLLIENAFAKRWCPLFQANYPILWNIAWYLNPCWCSDQGSKYSIQNKSSDYTLLVWNFWTIEKKSSDSTSTVQKHIWDPGCLSWGSVSGNCFSPVTLSNALSYSYFVQHTISLRTSQHDLLISKEAIWPLAKFAPVCGLGPKFTFFCNSFNILPKPLADRRCISWLCWQ